MSSSVLFSQHDNEVVVTGLVSGAVLWAGKPLGRRLLELVQLPRERRAVVLLDYHEAPSEARANLIAIDEYGAVLWTAEPPTRDASDAWTEMEVVDEGVSAFSWSGHRVLIDIETGATLKDNFTK